MAMVDTRQISAEDLARLAEKLKLEERRATRTGQSASLHAAKEKS
jgi:hypothetical protein